ncbi:MAG: T9SS type A sorting domain-containing protein [Chitinophagales bacterium]|nr:T9SS type A sorting domain-containing protein [Chitinophagales bacterium]
MKPISFPAPTVALTDTLGNIVITPTGQEIIMNLSNEASDKIEALYPAYPGYEWFGLQSNTLTTKNHSDVDSIRLIFQFKWTKLPLGSQDSIGYFWMSDDKDDLYCELITDVSTELAPFVFTSQSPGPLLYSFRIHPNPTSASFTVTLPTPARPGMRFRVTDLAGRMLQELETTPGTEQQTVQAGALPDGLYFLQVVENDRIIAVEKFVKQ